MQLGASLTDKNTSIALEYAARGPALLDVLYQYDWRDMRTSSLAFHRMLEWSLHTGPQELQWFLDHDAEVDKDLIRHAVHGAPIKVACVDLLLQRFGVKLFKGTRLLQNAAKRGKNDLIRLLLDAGMNVDCLDPPLTHDDGECEFTALYEAVYKQHEETVKILLEYGADPEKQVRYQGQKPSSMSQTFTNVYGFWCTDLHRRIEHALEARRGPRLRAHRFTVTPQRGEEPAGSPTMDIEALRSVYSLSLCKVCCGCLGEVFGVSLHFEPFTSRSHCVVLAVVRDSANSLGLCSAKAPREV